MGEVIHAAGRFRRPDVSEDSCAYCRAGFLRGVRVAVVSGRVYHQLCWFAMILGEPVPNREDNDQ